MCEWKLIEIRCLIKFVTVSSQDMTCWQRFEKKLSKKDKNKMLMWTEQEKLSAEICHVNLSLVIYYKNEVQ